jgi:RNA polymerase sigma-70 factor (ECF subfamily)
VVPDRVALLDVLDPDVVARTDAGVATVAAGATRFARLARLARPALADGATGLVVLADGRPERALTFIFVRDRIAVIDIVTDPGRVSALDIGLD